VVITHPRTVTVWPASAGRASMRTASDIGAAF
jgi:hypothetical protein